MELKAWNEKDWAIQKLKKFSWRKRQKFILTTLTLNSNFPSHRSKISKNNVFTAVPATSLNHPGHLASLSSSQLPVARPLHGPCADTASVSSTVLGIDAVRSVKRVFSNSRAGSKTGRVWLAVITAIEPKISRGPERSAGRTVIPSQSAI